MKKQLNTQAITNELESASAFFTRPAAGAAEPMAPAEPTPAVPARSPASPGTLPYHTPEAQNALQDNRQASVLASYQASVIETIRKTVKEVGKEVGFVRLTIEEKRQLADIVYTYKRQGVKTSENEINRIAINYLLEDYKANGQESMLAKVIAALLA